MSKELFRVENHNKNELTCLCFPIISETPKGYWIRITNKDTYKLKFDVCMDYYTRKWVSKKGNKVFARDNVEDALSDFNYRLKSHLRHLNNRLSELKEQITLKHDVLGKIKFTNKNLCDKFKKEMEKENYDEKKLSEAVKSKKIIVDM